MPRKTGIISLVFAFLLLAPNKTLAYDDKTTHPALTDEIVDFYNLTHSGAPLSSEQKEWLVQG
ncbi:MAG: hypothetical protein Q7S28_04015, partial [bacterium]|nr:hypothetical protein [bacterium]